MDLYCYSNLPCSNFSSELKSLKIRINNNNYVIPPAGYLIEDTFGHKCVIAVSYISDAHEEYILGFPFMRSFYTIFDY
jgi:hypothetical protein